MTLYNHFNWRAKEVDCIIRAMPHARAAREAHVLLVERRDGRPRLGELTLALGTSACRRRFAAVNPGMILKQEDLGDSSNHSAHRLRRTGRTK
jgi:hypothetical protein